MPVDRIDITENLIDSLISKVSPLVERELGWNLQLSTLHWRVLPRDRGYEEILLGRLRGAGVAVDENAPRSLLERLFELTLEANLLAAYDPGTQTIFIARENLDDSNLHGLMVILAHELVHRGQHIHHPELFSRTDAVIRNVYNALENEEIGLKQVIEEIKSTQAIMTLIESHAAYVQQQITHKYYPDAQVESHFNLLTLLFALLGGPKTAQYSGGLSEIAQAVANGDVEDLYRNIK